MVVQYRAASLIYCLAGFLVTLCLSMMHCSMAPASSEVFRGTFVGTEWQRADAMLYGIEALRSAGQTPTREDFDIPEGWTPPAGWAPPEGYELPPWFPDCQTPDSDATSPP